MKLRRIALAVALCALSGCSGQDGGTLDLRSEADLSGLTLATTKGSYYLDKFSKRPDVDLFVANSESDGVQAVLSGMADVFVGDEVTLTPEDMDRLGVKLAFRGEETFDVAFAVNKDDRAFKRRLDAFLSSAPLEDIIAYWRDGGPAVEEPAWEVDPEAAPLVDICVTDLSPVSYIGDEGEWMGFDIDILRRFSHSVGRDFEVRFQDLTSAIIALQTGEADCISGCLLVTEERKSSVDFSIPYYTCQPAYFIADQDHKIPMEMGERLKRNLVTDGRWKLIARGLLETVKITLLSILLGTVLGAGICACLRSRRKWVRSLARLYGSFINGMPTLVLLLIMFYVVLAGTGISASLVAVITFALCFASSAGRIFDTSISSVSKGQREAGLALGFTPFKTFTGIVFPQALKNGLPNFAGECVSLLKGTSIVGYIAIQDLTRAVDLIRGRTYDALVPLLIVTVLYFVLAWLIRLSLNLFLKK